ncbi:MAG: ComF family protein [Gemmatimonadales bacterium]
MTSTLPARSLLARSLHATADFFLPRICVACERPADARENGLVCALCRSRLALLAAPLCVRCGHPTGGRRCMFCEAFPPFVRAIRSVCWVPHEVGSAVVHSLKYHGWTGTARDMAAQMARVGWPPDVVAERAALVPVPLAATRERERGFNQAALLCDALSTHWGIPVWRDAITRTRATQSQTRLTPGERSANVHGAFAVPDRPCDVRDRLRGLHLVLVDDVLTTGATLNACATALFDAGARTISYVTFGRARASGDR